MHPRESYGETLNRLPDMAYDPEKGHQNVWQAPPMHRDGEFSRFSRYPEPGDTRLCDALPSRRGDARHPHPTGGSHGKEPGSATGAGA
ncbi:hypothetical protein [Methanoculleus sp. UBA413]|uniref:hypothetical protein n=1 Tax=Methanoculleus TaxID=45989 RepID=UPI0022EEA46E|nr:hypothetical protein MBOURGENBZM_05630 [Methanoculleus bourgensis]